MVINKDIFYNWLSNQQISTKGADEIKEMMKQYPYFQALYVLQTKYLKSNKLFYKNNLQQTAARTIDRKVLFEILENKTQVTQNEVTAINNSRKKEQEPEKNIKEEKTKEIISKVAVKTTPEPLVASSKPKKDYLSWLKSMRQEAVAKKNEQIFDVIDKFLKDRPKIIPKRNAPVKPPVFIEKSIEEKQMLMTETLANLYVKQKKYDKAIQAKPYKLFEY